MREIQFRGKRVDNEEWVYGFYYEWHSKKYPNKIDASIHVIDHDKNGVKIRDKQYSIITETAGQYTGLKDKKGKEIYEFDILRYSLDGYSKKEFNMEDVYSKGISKVYYNISAAFVIDIWMGGSAPLGYNFGNYPTSEFEIIGNIYENPELIKK